MIGWGLGQHQGDGFGQVAHGLVAFFEQPLGQARGLQRQRAQRCGADEPGRLAAGQEVHRPGRVGVGHLAQVAQQRGHLGVGGPARVELGEQRTEALHAAGAALAAASWSSSPLPSPPYAVLKPSAAAS